MQLYYNPISTYSRKVMLACYEKDISFTGVIVNLMDESAAAQYRHEVNPLGKVPFLLRDDGWKIPESSIIVEYLNQTHKSGPNLFPTDPDLCRQARFIDRMSDLYVNESIVTLFLQNMRPEAQRNKELIDRANTTLSRILPIIEKDMANKDFAIGGQLSIADLSATTAFCYADMVGVKLGPNTQAYLKKQYARPAWQRVNKETEPLFKAMQAANK